MYFKLAYKNVKKSYQDFFIYFVTLTISVSLFYVFNSFDSQSALFSFDDEIGYAMRTLEILMSAISIVVAVIFAILILYANNFLIKRRKLELAIYSLLGMKKSLINRILLYETLIVGVISLIFGMFFGVIFAQVSAAFSAKLLIIPFDYQFVFSISSLIKTTVIFLIIFFIVGIFNNLIVSKSKLIDLIKAKTISEKKNQNNFIMFLMFIASLNILWFAYSLTRDAIQFISLILLIIPIGMLGTFLLYKSLGFWFAKLISLNKKIYYKDLNMFVVEQLNFKINSTYRLLASVSLMLLIGFGGLASSFNLSNIVAKDLMENNPYDISFAYSQMKEANPIDISQFVKNDKIKDYFVVERISTGLLNYDLIDFKNDNQALNSYTMVVDMISESVYNNLRKQYDLSKLSLNDDEIVYFVSGVGHKPFIDNNKNFDSNLNLFDKEFIVLEDQDYNVNLRNGSTTTSVILVLNDYNFNDFKESMADFNQFNSYYINTNLKDPTSDNIELLMNEFWDITKDESVGISSVYTMQSAKANYREIVITFTYSGLYIGLVFIIVSVMVLSLQILSDASDNYERYHILSKLGVSKEKQRKALFKVTLIYFIFPLLVALLHSYIGIKAVVNTLEYGGFITSDYSIIYLAISVLAGLYIIYFIVSYYSSLVILKLK